MKKFYVLDKKERFLIVRNDYLNPDKLNKFSFNILDVFNKKKRYERKLIDVVKRMNNYLGEYEKPEYEVNFDLSKKEFLISYDEKEIKFIEFDFNVIDEIRILDYMVLVLSEKIKQNIVFTYYEFKKAFLAFFRLNKFKKFDNSLVKVYFHKNILIVRTFKKFGYSLFLGCVVNKGMDYFAIRQKYNLSKP